MLSLSRKLLEVIYIGNDVLVHLIRNDRANVVLGIEAPKEVVILRGELYYPPTESRADRIPWTDLWKLSRNVGFSSSFPHKVTKLTSGQNVVGVVLSAEEYNRLKKYDPESSGASD